MHNFQGCNNFRNTGCCSNSLSNNNFQSTNTSDVTSNNTLCGNWCNVLQNYIGRRCSCEFEIGNTLVKKTGILNNVGSRLIGLSSLNNSDTLLFCDLSNLVFFRLC